MYQSGSLILCVGCGRVIGYVNGDGSCTLKDVRPLYFVPIDVEATLNKQIVLFRVLEHGPLKRKCSAVCDEPPCKKYKFDNTCSVIVMRIRIEKDDSLPLRSETDLPIFTQTFDASDDESDTWSEFDTNVFDELLDVSDVDYEDELEQAVIEFHDDFITVRSAVGAVSQLFWVSSPYLQSVEQNDTQPLDLSMSSRKYICIFFLVIKIYWIIFKRRNESFRFRR